MVPQLWPYRGRHFFKKFGNKCCKGPKNKATKTFYKNFAKLLLSNHFPSVQTFSVQGGRGIHLRFKQNPMFRLLFLTLAISLVQIQYSTLLPYGLSVGRNGFSAINTKVCLTIVHYTETVRIHLLTSGVETKIQL